MTKPVSLYTEFHQHFGSEVTSNQRLCCVCVVSVPPRWACKFGSTHARSVEGKVGRHGISVAFMLRYYQSAGELLYKSITILAVFGNWLNRILEIWTKRWFSCLLSHFYSISLWKRRYTSASSAFNWSRKCGATLTCAAWRYATAQARNKCLFYVTALPKCWWNAVQLKLMDLACRGHHNLYMKNWSSLKNPYRKHWTKHTNCSLDSRCCPFL